MGPSGTLSGFGYITTPTVVNGTFSPSLTTPVSFNGTGNLTMNNLSTFVLTASGGQVSQVLNVGTFSTPSGVVSLVPNPLDGTSTLNASSSYEFLSWTNGGPAPGVQSNWSLGGAATISWTSGDDHVNWSDPENWSGPNWGGQVVAVSDGGTTGELDAVGLSYGYSAPAATSTVLIQTNSGATVAGPTSATFISSLTLGLSSGTLNELDINPLGPLTITGAAGTTVNATGYLNVGSGTVSTTSLSVAGSVAFATGGSLSASGGATVGNSGVLNIGSGSFSTTSLSITGTTSVGSGGSLFATGPVNVTSPGVLNIASGNYQGAGLTITGTASVTSGGSLTATSNVGLAASSGELSVRQQQLIQRPVAERVRRLGVAVQHQRQRFFHTRTLRRHDHPVQPHHDHHGQHLRQLGYRGQHQQRQRADLERQQRHYDHRIGGNRLQRQRLRRPGLSQQHRRPGQSGHQRRQHDAQLGDGGPQRDGLRRAGELRQHRPLD